MNSKDFNKLQDIFSSKSFEEEVEHETYMFALLLLSQIEKEAESQGINRKELAKKIGKSPSYLTQLFRSNKIPNLKVITAMALALGKKFDAQVVDHITKDHEEENIHYKTTKIENEYLADITPVYQVLNKSKLDINETNKSHFTVKNSLLKTINIEIKDFDYYFVETFNPEKLDLDFSFQFSRKEGYLELFLHFRYNYIKNDESKSSIYHSDHIVKFVSKEFEKLDYTLDLNLLAELLGRSIIMFKGSFEVLTKGYQINQVTLPFFNPIELVNARYKDVVKSGKVIVA